MMKCNTCGADLDVPTDAKEGEIVSCPSCGTEYNVHIVNNAVELLELILDGEDWGE